MTSRERVIAVLEHRAPDRIPVYGWVRANLEDSITAAFGSVEAFEERYEFDLAHIFGGPSPYDGEELDALRAARGGAIAPKDLLDMDVSDPNDTGAFQNIWDAVKHYKDERSRFVYVQTPGIFECLNGPFGIENHLMYLALYENDLREVYRRQAEWNKAFAMNCLDLDVDMIHVSDDWGGQQGLLFSPETWHKLIFPYHKITADAVLARGGYLSLHSDGNISQILDGIAELGYQVVHPYQESAGMDFDLYLRRYANAFTIMGGLDVQTTLGFGNLPRLKSEIERVIRLFEQRGLILCTTHFVQNHCSIEELTFAYDLVAERIRKPGGADS